MNVLLDAHFLDKKKEGNRTFLLTLIAGLDAMGKRDKVPHFFVAVYHPEMWRREFHSPNLHWVKCSRYAWRRYLRDFPRLIHQHDIHLIQHTYHLPILGVPAGVGKILVVHDILPISHPEQFSFWFRKRFGFLLRHSLMRSDRVVCGSNFTRAALMRELRVAEERIRLIHYGVLAKPAEKVFQERNNTALFVGRLDRRKNLSKVLDIVEAANALMPVTLLLAGRRENVSATTWARIEKLSSQGLVHYLGQVSDSTLKELFRTAGVLLYFSVAEGFGYPVLEAMAHGLPYLTSNAGAVGELAAKENVVDPDDPDGVAAKLVRILSDYDYRLALVEAGLRKAQEHTVEQMGKDFIKLYKEFC